MVEPSILSLLNAIVLQVVGVMACVGYVLSVSDAYQIGQASAARF